MSPLFPFALFAVWTTFYASLYNARMKRTTIIIVVVIAVMGYVILRGILSG